MTESIVDDSSPKDERERGLDALAKYFAAARKIVFLTGAGVSTESGIPDFRSTTGIYSVTSEEIFSIEFFHENPERFYSFFAAFYRGITDARPNAGHLAIAELERRCGKSVEVVTQNIDGLHGLAGSTKVHEIHGTLRSATCTTCDRRYEESFFRTICSRDACRAANAGAFSNRTSFSTAKSFPRRRLTLRDAQCGRRNFSSSRGRRFRSILRRDCRENATRARLSSS